VLQNLPFLRRRFSYFNPSKIHWQYPLPIGLPLNGPKEIDPYREACHIERVQTGLSPAIVPRC
jgi:hypothetical protein